MSDHYEAQFRLEMAKYNASLVAGRLALWLGFIALMTITGGFIAYYLGVRL